MVQKLALSLIALLGIAAMVTAQNKQVSGTVTGVDGTPIAGATVIVDGTSVGTSTGADGRFSLSTPDNGTLTVSFIGYDSQKLALDGKTLFAVMLKEDAHSIDDVVVVAYGTQSARTATSSISKIKGDVLKDVPSVSVDQMMQGRSAGVQITTPNAGVGQASRVLIRGVSSISAGTSPLYIVDGVPIATGELSWASNIGNANGLSDINPADIVSIDILKDAAATALYGSRAASGVVLITTKGGGPGTC